MRATYANRSGSSKPLLAGVRSNDEDPSCYGPDARERRLKQGSAARDSELADEGSRNLLASRELHRGRRIGDH